MIIEFYIMENSKHSIKKQSGQLLHLFTWLLAPGDNLVRDTT